MIIVTKSFSKNSVFKMFSVHSTLKRKAGVFKFLRFEEHFWKAPFSWRVSVDGRPNRRDKAAISNSATVVWTRPKGPLFFLSFITYIWVSTVRASRHIHAKLMNTNHKERAHLMPMPIQHTSATSTPKWNEASLLALLENEKSIVLVFLQTTEALARACCP